MTRRVTAGLFMSIDGVVEADDDWQYDWFDAELFDVISGGMAAADCVLMGRESGTGYASLRTEHPESPMLAFLDSVQRFVVSGSARGPGWEHWPGTGLIRPGDLADTVRDMRQQAGRDVQVAGSPSVVRALLAADLLDELLLMLLPIVVGTGHRLFPEAADGTGPARMPLRLLESRPLGSGAVVLRYGRV